MSATAPTQYTAAAIRTLRVRLGLSQEEFAHALGMTYSAVNRWERGRGLPSKLARRMLDALRANAALALLLVLASCAPDPTSAVQGICWEPCGGHYQGVNVQSDGSAVCVCDDGQEIVLD